MKTIKLAGKLGKVYGSSFRLNVQSPAEAIRALCYQLDGFEDALKNGSYRVVYGNEEIDESLLVFEAQSRRTIEIIPVPHGSKSGGIGKIILGVVLVGAAFFFGGGALVGTAFSVGGVGVTYGQIALLGGLLAVAGITSMLAPSMTDDTDKENKQSFLGAVPANRQEQGALMPIVFGFSVPVGSVMISAGISVEEY